MGNQTYQGEKILSIRDAKEGDEGFKADQKGQDQQVHIRLQNGTEKVVKKSEVQGQA